jgi:hypothetical protein
MSKAHTLFWVMWLNGVLMWFEILSGYVLWLVLPYSQGRDAVFVIPRPMWSTLHMWGSIAVTALLVVHIAMHWGWIVRQVRSLFKSGQRRESVPQQIVPQQAMPQPSAAFGNGQFDPYAPAPAFSAIDMAEALASVVPVMDQVVTPIPEPVLSVDPVDSAIPAQAQIVNQPASKSRSAGYIDRARIALKARSWQLALAGSIGLPVAIGMAAVALKRSSRSYARSIAA